jgi:hypothetical protein
VAAIPKACVLCFSFSCVVPNKIFEERTERKKKKKKKKKKKEKKKKKDERLFVLLSE